MIRYLRHLKNLCFNLWWDRMEPTLSLDPKLSAQKVGISVSGQPIQVYQIGQGQRSILFLSALHGNEVGTVKFANRLINWLAGRLELHQHFNFFIIPCLNVDGYIQAQQYRDYSHGGLVGRLNAREVDLNRNFATASFQSMAQWNYGKRYAKKREVYAGASGNSEPEIQALIALIEQREIEVIFSFHNAGKDVLASNNELGHQLASLYTQMSGYRLISEKEWLGLGQTGTLKEWCDEHHFTFLEIEASNRYRSDWEINLRAIQKILSLLMATEP